MANKPAALCQLEKNKLIDTQNGFVDTFNWAVNAIANLTGGENCEVNWTVDDKPTIDFTGEEGGGSGGGSGGGGVYDVFPSTSDGVEGIGVDYIRAKPDSFIPFPSASVSFIGTDGTVGAQANEFTFEHPADSNVIVSAIGQSIYVAVYYV